MSYRLGETIDAWMQGASLVKHLGPAAIADYIRGLAQGQNIAIHDVFVKAVPLIPPVSRWYVAVYHTDVYPLWRQWQHVTQTAFTLANDPVQFLPWPVWLQRINAWQQQMGIGMPTNVDLVVYDNVLERIAKATGYTLGYGDIWVNRIHDSLQIGFLTRAGEFTWHCYVDSLTNPPVPEGFRL